MKDAAAVEPRVSSGLRRLLCAPARTRVARIPIRVAADATSRYLHGPLIMATAADLLSTLHPLEAKVLRALLDDGSEVGEDELPQRAGITDAQTRMACEWLLAKGAVAVAREDSVPFIHLDEVGRAYAGNGNIPELRIRRHLENGPATMADLGDPKELSAAIGTLKKAGLIQIVGGKFALAPEADWSIIEGDQHLVSKLAAKERWLEADLAPTEWARALDLAAKPGRAALGIRRSTQRQRTYVLTELGTQVAAAAGGVAVEVSQLTPDMLRDGTWRAHRFRAYNLQIPPPRIAGGRRHPYREFLDTVERKLLAFGFEEMRGPIVESEFWNNDALYMPQFHPARAIHDVYFIEGFPKCRMLPEPAASRVAAAHTNGGGTGSTGWRYTFDTEATKRLILRSQGTALSVRQLAMRPRVPGKYFGIARCFRYDQVDATHAPDFFQVEGIMLGEEINLRHLLGLLKLFALEIARAEEMRFAPGYFPFTEPSVEAHMRHPTIGWMELGGAGILRPEVTQPFGIDVPVIAWGLGLDRMAMVALGINDIRDLFSPDLDFLRSKRIPLMI
jgi:phenylalanyl-tRNA synthetase alpha chain